MIYYRVAVLIRGTVKLVVPVQADTEGEARALAALVLREEPEYAALQLQDGDIAVTHVEAVEEDEPSRPQREVRRTTKGSHLVAVQLPEDLIYPKVADVDVPVLYFGVNDAVHFVDAGREKAGPYGRQSLPRNQDDVYFLVEGFYVRFGECDACHPPEREDDVEDDAPFHLHYNHPDGRLLVTCPNCGHDYNSLPIAEADVRKGFYVEAINSDRSILLPLTTAEAPHLRTAVAHRAAHSGWQTQWIESFWVGLFTSTPEASGDHDRGFYGVFALRA